MNNNKKKQSLCVTMDGDQIIHGTDLLLQQMKKLNVKGLEVKMFPVHFNTRV